MTQILRNFLEDIELFLSELGTPEANKLLNRIEKIRDLFSIKN